MVKCEDKGRERKAHVFHGEEEKEKKSEMKKTRSVSSFFFALTFSTKVGEKC